MHAAWCRLAAVNLVDAQLCTDAGKYVAALLASLGTMLHLELPHVNLLSKADLIPSFGELDFDLSFYLEVRAAWHTSPCRVLQWSLDYAADYLPELTSHVRGWWHLQAQGLEHLVAGMAHGSSIPHRFQKLARELCEVCCCQAGELCVASVAGAATIKLCMPALPSDCCCPAGGRRIRPCAIHAAGH